MRITVVFSITLVMWLAGIAAGDVRLRPAELELIDGGKVRGQLAAETGTHLVVYSTDGGALRTVPRALVHSLTVEGARRELSPRRPLTEAEAKVPSCSDWPDAAPATGPKPDYTLQKWKAPKRLVIWSKPGKSGRITDRANWQVVGDPLDAGAKMWDDQTDAILPACDTTYTAVGGVEEPVSGRLHLVFRHMSIENGAKVRSQDASVSGNLWIHAAGAFDIRFSVIFVGPQHTFIRNDRARLFKVGVNPHKMPGSVMEGYYIAQYITVRKEKDASVEFLGHFLSNDKFNHYSGRCIIGPDSAIMTSNRNPDHIHPGATLEVMSGAIWGKHIQRNRSISYIVEGTVTIGSESRPITQDTYIAMPFKDYSGAMGGSQSALVAKDWAGGDVLGFFLTAKGRMREFSADPAKARVVFCHHKRETGADCLDFNLSPGQLGRRSGLYQKLPRRIDLVFLGDVELDGVLFQDVYKGGIRLKDLAMKEKFQNVFWGSDCGGKPEEMFGVFMPNTPPNGWVEEVTPLLKDD